MFVIAQRESRQNIHLPITPEIAFATSLSVNAEVNPHEVRESDLAVC
jgi:hypothetical protein